METEQYIYNVETKGICYIWKKREVFDKFVGSVTIDKTNAWTPHYQDGVTYLPINSALKLMGYKPCEQTVVE